MFNQKSLQWEIQKNQNVRIQTDKAGMQLVVWVERVGAWKDVPILEDVFDTLPRHTRTRKRADGNEERDVITVDMGSGICGFTIRFTKSPVVKYFTTSPEERSLARRWWLGIEERLGEGAEGKNIAYIPLQVFDNMPDHRSHDFTDLSQAMGKIDIDPHAAGFAMNILKEANAHAMQRISEGSRSWPIRAHTQLIDLRAYREEFKEMCELINGVAMVPAAREIVMDIVNKGCNLQKVKVARLAKED